MSTPPSPLRPQTTCATISDDSSGADGTNLPLSPGALTAAEATIHFDALNFGAIVGSGAYGRVFRGTYRGGDVAIKSLAVRALQSENMIKYLHSELAALSSLSHPHLIKYYGAAQRGKEVFIVTEFLPGGTLADILSPSAPLLSWPLLISLARAAAEGLAALHTADVLHRDIKSENLLLDDDWRLVIADYGFARRHEGDGGARRGAAQTMTIVGTEAFMAPEVTFGEPYGAGADVFALGCVLAQIIVRQTPGSNGFLERTPRNKFRCDLDALRAAAPVDAPPSFVECAAQCLAYEPEDRLTAENAAEWLKELEEELLLVAAATSTTASLSASGGGSVSSSSGGGAAMTTSNHRLTRAEAPKPSIILANTRLHTASAMTTIISNEITTGDGDGDIN